MGLHVFVFLWLPRRRKCWMREWERSYWGQNPGFSIEETGVFPSMQTRSLKATPFAKKWLKNWTHRWSIHPSVLIHLVGQSVITVEWGDFPFICLFVRLSPPHIQLARPEAKPARPEAQPARPEAQPSRLEAQQPNHARGQGSQGHGLRLCLGTG